MALPTAVSLEDAAVKHPIFTCCQMNRSHTFLLGVVDLPLHCDFLPRLYLAQ